MAKSEPKAEAAKAEAAELPKSEPKAEAASVYVVAPGRSITSPRGILTAGTVVDPARDRISDINALVEIGAVVRG